MNDPLSTYQLQFTYLIALEPDFSPLHFAYCSAGSSDKGCLLYDYLPTGGRVIYKCRNLDRSYFGVVGEIRR